MSISRSFALVLVALAAAACGSAQPTAQRFAKTTLHVPVAPQLALTRMKADAAARGWRVVDEGVDSIVVDFGVATARVPVPADDGLFATPTTPRVTEVHATALFRFDAEPPGASVTMWNNPVYWHPDWKVWLPAPSDLAPGDLLLRELSSARATAPRSRGAVGIGEAE